MRSAISISDSIRTGQGWPSRPVDLVAVHCDDDGPRGVVWFEFRVAAIANPRSAVSGEES